MIHAHIDWLHLPLLSRLDVPFVTTLHGRLDLRGVSDVIGRFPAAPFVSISDNQRLPIGKKSKLDRHNISWATRERSPPRVQSGFLSCFSWKAHSR